MAPPLRYRVPAVVLIFIGLGILGVVDARVETLSRPQYDHAVVEISEDEKNEMYSGEPVHRLENFSELAREAFLEAVNSDGSHTTTTPAPDLSYAGDDVGPETTYVIRYQGSLYLLTPRTGGPEQGPAVGILLTYGLPAAGIVIAVGMYNLLARQPSYIAGLVGGLVAAITSYVLSASPLEGDTLVWITAAVGLGVLPWFPLRYLAGGDQNDAPET